MGSVSRNITNESCAPQVIMGTGTSESYQVSARTSNEVLRSFQQITLKMYINN